MSGRRRRLATRGSALVEVASIAVAVMLMVFAGFEFSRMVLVYTSVANSAKAGVRYAIVHGSDRSGGSGVDGASGVSDYSQIINVVKNYASSWALDPSTLTVQVQYPASTETNPGNSIGSTVIVKVSYQYDPFVSVLPLRVPLSSQASGIIVY